MKPPILRLLLALARHLLTPTQRPAGKARPVGTAQVTITPNTSTLDRAATLSDCPHCDPDHLPPWTGTWAAFLPTTRDGRPTVIHLMRPNGSHVAERDATWAQDVLRAAAEEHHRPLTEIPTDEATARLRADASHATGMFMALDLHQALNLPYDPQADHQGHQDHATWWADLLGRVRARERTTTGSTPVPAPLESTDLHARAFNALTHAIADHDRFLPLGTREHATRQILNEIADDLLDPDQTPDPDHITIQAGTSTYTRCPVCEQDDARFTLTHYILGDQGQVHPVGRADVCTECLHSPFQHTATEPQEAE